MSYAEDILKLRRRIGDAVSRGLFSSESKDFFEGTLIQIMNDAERNRQNCLSQSENFRRQAAVADGQAGAFSSTISIVYNVLNGLVAADEKDDAERARAAAEKAELEKESLPINEQDLLPVNETKKSRKKS